ncbi:hypothetical protein BamIOP4010DRAFT_5985 [Burkholderia ambifaria IOP40-10]|uniref:Lipoprotein n=1 Tax=Burkholderia ambifaria IOP40-10 TaxID=396596 RepID=B1FPM4_9BURK|nr:hypothetical protein BamIOP4010DRAFT_5985 [Burkholderia ambifaria IOP40-10]
MPVLALAACAGAASRSTNASASCTPLAPFNGGVSALPAE